MADTRTETERVRCQDLELLSWRYDELIRAGYPVDVALVLAERSDVDLRLACSLLTRGATLDEAIRILA